MNDVQSKLSYKKCLTEALKYSSIREFYANARPFYNQCHKKGWLNKVTKSIRKRKFKSYTWTKSLVLKESFKYRTIRDFKLYSTSAFNYAKSNNFLDKLRFNPKAKLRATSAQFSQKVRIITKEDCIKAALRHETKMQFYSNENSHYQYALRHKIMNEVCSHMIKQDVNAHEKLIEESIIKYQNLKSWYAFRNTYLYQKLSKENLLQSFKEKLGKKNNQYQEKELVNTLYNRLICDYKLKIHKEYKLPKKDGINGRIDLFIKLENGESFGIEYKAGKASWTSKGVSKQINKYKRCLRDRKGFIGIFLVSDNGKYGMSEQTFLKWLEKKLRMKNSQTS